jgi:hypothetical protein
MRSSPALIVAIALQVAGSPALAQRLPFQKSFDAAGVTTLDVSTIRGKINVVSGETDRIQIGGAVTIRIGIDVPENPLEIAQRNRRQSTDRTWRRHDTFATASRRTRPKGGHGQLRRSRSSKHKNIDRKRFR